MGRYFYFSEKKIKVGSFVQVEMHPKWRQAKLRKFCGDQNIHVSAYSPLGGPGTLWGSKAILDNPIIQSIAHKHKATSAQVNQLTLNFSFCF